MLVFLPRYSCTAPMILSAFPPEDSVSPLHTGEIVPHVHRAPGSPHCLMDDSLHGSALNAVAQTMLLASCYILPPSHDPEEPAWRSGLPASCLSASQRPGGGGGEEGKQRPCQYFAHCQRKSKLNCSSSILTSVPPLSPAHHSQSR